MTVLSPGTDVAEEDKADVTEVHRPVHLCGCWRQATQTRLKPLSALEHGNRCNGNTDMADGIAESGPDEGEDDGYAYIGESSRLERDLTRETENLGVCVCSRPARI